MHVQCHSLSAGLSFLHQSGRDLLARENHGSLLRQILLHILRPQCARAFKLGRTCALVAAMTLEVSQSVGDIGYRSDISQIMNIWLYRPASKKNECSSL